MEVDDQHKGGYRDDQGSDCSRHRHASFSRRTLRWDLLPGHAGAPQRAHGRAGHRGRSAEEDVARGDVGYELAQVLRREQVAVARVAVVADRVVHAHAAELGEAFQLVAEDQLARVDCAIARSGPRCRH